MIQIAGSVFVKHKFIQHTEQKHHFGQLTHNINSEIDQFSQHLYCAYHTSSDKLQQSKAKHCQTHLVLMLSQ